jgi:flagellar assembly protein FliH
MEYPDMAAHLLSATPGMVAKAAAAAARKRHTVDLTEEELAARIQRERVDAVQQVEQKLRLEYEAKLEETRAPVAAAIAAFEIERSGYYSRVEAEVVQLALAISAKILHREAQVDPMLVAAVVRITIEKMREGSSVTVRVAQGRGKKWQAYFDSQPATAKVEVVEDSELTCHDCFLETELGVTNFGLDTQLKEVERGFFDLLALRPESR